MNDNPLEIESEEEFKRLKKLRIHQQLFCFLLWEKKWHLIIALLACLLLGFTLRILLFPRAPFKYKGEVTLFYTPRGSHEVKALSINQVLEVFCRKQAIRQLDEELALTPSERKKLSQCIEVKMVKDHPNMFKIYGKGPTEDFVKRTVNTFADIGIRNYKNYRMNELNSYLDDRLKLREELHLQRQELIDQEDKMYKHYNILRPLEEMTRIKKLNSEQNTQLAELNVQLANAVQKLKMINKQYQSIPRQVIDNAYILKRYCDEIRARRKALEEIKLTFIDRNPRTIERQTSLDNALYEFEEFKKEQGIKEFREDMLFGLPELVQERDKAKLHFEVLQSNIAAIRHEMEQCQEIQVKLQRMIPEYNSISQSSQTINKSIALVNEEIIKIRGKMAHVSSDITLNERLYGASSDKMFSAKIIMLIIVGSCMLAGAFVSILIFCDIVYGTVRNIDEMTILKDYMPLLGITPHPALVLTDEQRDTLINSMYYNIIKQFETIHTVFAGSLENTVQSTQVFYNDFAEIHGNTVAISLMPLNKIEMLSPLLHKEGNLYLSDQNYTHCTYKEIMELRELQLAQPPNSLPPRTIKLGDHNIYVILPVKNPNVLSPQELVQLKACLARLQQYYSLVVVARELDFKNPCMLIKQLLDTCDVTMLFIGKKLTHRKVVRKILDLKPEQHQVFAVLTEVTQLDKIVTGDYF